MPTFTADGVPQYSDWKPEATGALFDQLKMLDPAKVGVNRSQLRTFYPYLGWNDLEKGLNSLIASGRADRTVTTVNGKPLEVFVWKGS